MRSRARLQQTVSKEEAVESAICCGWIDGQLKPSDEHAYLVRMTPRRRGSRWSARNCATAEQLAQQGRLKPEGSREIDEAKRDGRWAAAYQSQAKAEPPPDFMQALEKNKTAAKFFETLDRANRFSFIYRVNDARRPETRARRIADFVDMLARGETLHPKKERRLKSQIAGRSPNERIDSEGGATGAILLPLKRGGPGGDRPAPRG